MARVIRSRSSLALLLGLLFALSALWSLRADQAGQAGRGRGEGPSATASLPGCPGREMGTQTTGGKNEGRPSPTAVVNGQPMSGNWWEKGARSYWHCHPGGQFMWIMQGVGRVQKRGERMRNLFVGDTEYAGPMVEHWHGASDFSDGQYIQVAFTPTGTRWMEPVTDNDYLGNDNGFESRVKFIAQCATASALPTCPDKK